MKKSAKKGVDLIRHLRDRLEYELQIRDTPSINPSRKKNVLIITIDCLRNDRISRTGYHRRTTPFLDSLKSFTPAITAAPWTFSSVPSILTGLYPHNHGACYLDDESRNQDLGNPPKRVRDDVHSLPELLAVSGYETRIDTAIETAILPLIGRFKTTSRHHNQDAEEVLSAMQSWWNKVNKPKFGYVQLGDLHEPLQSLNSGEFGDIPNIDGIQEWRFEKGEVHSEQFDRYKDARELLYDTLVLYVDRQI